MLAKQLPASFLGDGVRSAIRYRPGGGFNHLDETGAGRALPQYPVQRGEVDPDLGTDRVSEQVADRFPFPVPRAPQHEPPGGPAPVAQ